MVGRIVGRCLRRYHDSAGNLQAVNFATHPRAARIRAPRIGTVEIGVRSHLQLVLLEKPGHGLGKRLARLSHVARGPGCGKQLNVGVSQVHPDAVCDLPPSGKTPGDVGIIGADSMIDALKDLGPRTENGRALCHKGGREQQCRRKARSKEKTRFLHTGIAGANCRCIGNHKRAGGLACRRRRSRRSRSC
jgi:hypothetical protein